MVRLTIYVREEKYIYKYIYRHTVLIKYSIIFLDFNFKN